MKKLDQRQRFLFEENPIRGQYVSLDKSWQQVVKQSGLQGRGLLLLGEALAAVALLVDTLKIDGSVTLQVRGNGPMNLLVVEANSKDEVRGIAKQGSEIEKSMSLADIFGSNHLVITIQSGDAYPHQGIVELLGINFAEALEHYFISSEQLPTRFWLACNQENVSGMLLQKLPGKVSDEDAWDRLVHFSSTITDSELQHLPIESILNRLFHEELVRLFDAKPVEFSCSCSRSRTANMLITLGKSEVEDIIKQEAAVSVSCEFCNANYSFDAVDVAQLFSEIGSGIASTKTH